MADDSNNVTTAPAAQSGTEVSSAKPSDAVSAAVLEKDAATEAETIKVIQASEAVDSMSPNPEESAVIDGEHHESSGFWAKLGNAFSGMSFGLKLGAAIGGTLLIAAAVVAVIIVCK